MFPLYRKKKSMKEIWGGEALGARTHGGQDPPHRATGSADGSTVPGWRPIPSREQRCRGAGDAGKSSVDAEWVGRERPIVPGYR
jgi:hypothetical protein